VERICSSVRPVKQSGFIASSCAAAAAVRPLDRSGEKIPSGLRVTLQPGRVLDGHVHDVLGFPEPVWPYSTHPKAQARLRDWLKLHRVEVTSPGQACGSDNCFVHVGGFRDSFAALNESHALCLAVLVARYLQQHGRRIPLGNFRL
jgi:hypothetical protein